MKAILLSLCVTASAALLPPMPSVPTVKRPAPALSPKHASAPKTTPMVKAGGFVPASYAAAPFTFTLTHNINFFGCDTNLQDCILYDAENLDIQQRAGPGLVVEFCDALTESEWAWCAIISPCPAARTVIVEKLQAVPQRPPQRTYRVRETPAPAARAGKLAGVDIQVISPLVRAWVRPK